MTASSPDVQLRLAAAPKENRRLGGAKGVKGPLSCQFVAIIAGSCVAGSLARPAGKSDSPLGQHGFQRPWCLDHRTISPCRPCRTTTCEVHFGGPRHAPAWSP
ncbi:hypothetical protein GCM10008026_01990 [Chelatococcus composti]|nr:hypothetical protein GCM10008026_01990 [Chelatococcus composti]